MTASTSPAIFARFWQTYEKSATKFERLNRKFFEVTAEKPATIFDDFYHPPGKDHRRNDRIHALLRNGRAADKDVHRHGLQPPEGMDALFPVMGSRCRPSFTARFFCHCHADVA